MFKVQERWSWKTLSELILTLILHVRYCAHSYNVLVINRRIDKKNTCRHFENTRLQRFRVEYYYYYYCCTYAWANTRVIIIIYVLSTRSRRIARVSIAHPRRLASARAHTLESRTRVSHRGKLIVATAIIIIIIIIVIIIFF